MNNTRSFPWLGLLTILAFFLSACTRVISTQTATESPTVTSTPSLTPTETPEPTGTQTATITPTVTVTPLPTLSPTVTLTPTPSLSPTITPWPTRVGDPVSVKMQANCRYGPGQAYLYRWGLYPGDTAKVDGKNQSGTWYWIQPSNLDSHCWASEIVFNETLDKATIPVVQVPLPKTTFAGPPQNVRAVREGNEVTVKWDDVILSEDKRRGYLLEVMTCNDGILIYQPVQTDSSSITFTDYDNCVAESGGLLYTAEKHGYSDPVRIPWPE